MGIGQFFGAWFAVSLLAGGMMLVGWLAWRLIGMFMMREIDGLELIILLAVLVGLMFGALTGGGLSIVALVLMWMVGMAYPLINRFALQRRMNAMLRDDIRAYEEALKRQPDVPFPHRRLGDIYFDREEWDKAAEHYRKYLEIHEINAHCSNRLERALLYKRREELGLRTCPVCGAENPGEAARCEACGFYLKGVHEFMDVFATPRMMRGWRWTILGLLVIAVVLRMIGGAVEWLSVLAMILCACAAVFYIYARMTGRERGVEL